MIALNMQTVMVASVVIHVVCLTVMLQLWRNNRDKFAGLNYWVVDWALQIAGGLLVALRGTVPDWASMVLGNAMIMSGTLILYFGVCIFAGMKNSRALNFIIAVYLIVFIIIQIYFGLIEDNLLIRSINVSSGLVFASLLAMWLMFMGVGSEIRGIAKGTGIAFGLVALISLLRISGFIFLPQTNNDFLQSGPVDSLLMMLLIGSVAFLVFNLVLMVNRRLDLETKRMKDAVLKTERELQAIFKATSVGFAVLVNRVISEVNDAACKMLGYSRQEIIGKGTRMFYASEEEYQNSAALYPQMALLGTTTSEIRFIKKDGTILNAIMNVSPIEKNNLSQGVVLSLIDISERKQSEQTLKASEQNFRNSMDNSPLGIRIVTESGETLYANRSVLDIFGYDRLEDLQATPLKNRCTPATYEEYRIRLDKRQRGEPVQDKNEISIVRKDGAIRHLQIFRKEALWGGKPQYQVIYQDITERKQSEDEIQEANSWLSYTQEAANAGFWDWDMITGKLKWSKEFFKLFGLGSESKPTFDAWLQVLHPDDREKASSRIEKSIQDHTELYNEYRIVLPEGKVRWIGAIGKTLYDNDGKAQRMSGICIDISERKSIEQSLLSSEENFRNSMDNSPLGIRIVAEGGETLYTNQAFLDIHGCNSLAEFNAVPFKTHYTPESYVEIEKRIDSRRRGEMIESNSEISIVRKDGMIRRLQVLYKEALWGGKPQYQAFYLDITERKQAEEALLTSEENFRNSIDNSPMGIRIFGKDGVTLYANQALLDIWGYENLAEMKAMPVKNLFSPQGQDYLQTRRNRILRGEPVSDNYENSIVRKDGTIRRVQIVRKEVLWGGERHYQGLYMDITERKQAEETLKLASAQLEESYQKEKQQWLELQEEARARGMFIDILGHELRTPLTPLTVCADMLQTTYSTQEGSIEKELADKICTSTKLLAKRLEELLDLAKYTRGGFTLHSQKVNLADLINQTALRFKPLNQQEGQSLLLEIQPGLPEVEADPSSLEQVLVNLLSNAHKYSPKDSHITLKARKQDAYLIIEVQDEGQGVSPDEKEQLFNPYHRVRQDTQKYPGIGLGLAISKQIVEAHQGKIWVESQSGQGNTFIVQLPINHTKGGN